MSYLCNTHILYSDNNYCIIIVISMKCVNRPNIFIQIKYTLKLIIVEAGGETYNKIIHYFRFSG